MSKKRRKNKKSKVEFPNYTFGYGTLEGQDVKSLIAEGLSGIQRITHFVASESPEAGFSYSCTGSIVYELSKAIGTIVDENRGSERAARCFG